VEEGLKPKQEVRKSIVVSFCNPAGGVSSVCRRMGGLYGLNIWVGRCVESRARSLVCTASLVSGVRFKRNFALRDLMFCEPMRGFFSLSSYLRAGALVRLLLRRSSSRYRGGKDERCSQDRATNFERREFYQI
jgi:hypothetical protein